MRWLSRTHRCAVSRGCRNGPRRRLRRFAVLAGDKRRSFPTRSFLECALAPVPDSSRCSGGRAPRPGHLAGVASRVIAAAGSGRVCVGPGDVSGANLPQSGPAGGLLAQGRNHRGVHRRGLLRRRCRSARLILYHEFHSRACHFHSCARVPHFRTVAFPAKRRNLSAGALVVKRRYEVSVTRSTWNSQL